MVALETIRAKEQLGKAPKLLLLTFRIPESIFILVVAVEHLRFGLC